MEIRKLHKWPADKFEAMDIQNELAEQVQILSSIEVDEIKTVAAVDTAYGVNAEVIFAAAAVFSFPDIDEIERRFQYDRVEFPYIPGMFYFREGPTIEKVLLKLESDPDLIIIHGHGIAHPRSCGLASHIGLLFDKPTIGCARKLIVGHHREIPPGKGNSQPITLNGRQVGLAYRSKEKVKPIFISPGHKCDISLASEITIKNMRGYRQPEPLRLAHLFANKFKRHIERKAAQKE